MNLTYEESVEAARPIKAIAELSRTLNVEYLRECVSQMKDGHSFRESAMILNSSPFTAIEQGDLEAAKIKGLELMIELAENQNEILKKTIQLSKAKNNSAELSRMFGL